MGRYFGTDGIRGIANKALTADLAFRVGASTGHIIKKDAPNARMLVGSDTRISKDVLAGALISGLCYSGIDVVHIGVLPTPALAFLIDRLGAEAGIMISASHNPYEYNGLKVISKGGIKLPDEKEDEIEKLIDRFELEPCERMGRLSYDFTAKDIYCYHIKDALEADISNFNVILDCSNGAASKTSQEIFESFGIIPKIYSNHPNGMNINENCGSTHIEVLGEIVARKGADIGFAFDGDADRCLAVDSKGRPIGGDKIMAVIALYLKKKGRLKNNALVATVMSNMGLIDLMKQNGIDVPLTGVGDRYVLEKMLAEGYVLGGEDSGHIIFLEKATTGDGQLTAMMLMCAMKELGLDSVQVHDIFTPYPNVQINVTADDLQKRKLMKDEIFRKDIAKAEEKFSGHGRILVRPSGTEPYIRILVEGKDKELVQKTAAALDDSVNIRLSQLF